MKRNLLAICVFFLPAIQMVNAQEYQLASQVYPEFRYYPLAGEVYFKDYRQVEGNAFLSDDWVRGDIYLTNGEVLKSVQYKMDAYLHHLLVYNDYVKRVIYLRKEFIDHFTMEEDNRTRNFRHVISDKSLRLGNKEFLMEVLMEGRITLYKLYFREILPLRTPEMPYIDEFINGETYYMEQDNEFIVARLRRSFIFSQFPQYKEEIKHYSRKNRLHIKNDKDFAELIRYINTLLPLPASED